jgi:hypothetical protein
VLRPRARVPYGDAAMTELHETEIDGVRCFWVDSGRPTLAAQLAFRCGTADEPVPESGWLHLIEHLALHGREAHGLQLNGSVSPLTTSFDAHGPVGAVVEHLASVTRFLSEPRLDDLDRERRVLRAESELRAGPVQRAFGWRYGARGPGALAYAEAGLGAATAEGLRDRAARVFTSGNAVLVLDGPPPTELRLSLPAGELSLPRPTVPCESAYPAAYRDGPGVILHGTVERSPSAPLFASLLQLTLKRVLRDTDGGAYAPWAHYEPVDLDQAMVVAGSDLLADAVEGAPAQLTRAMADLARHGFPTADLEQQRALLLQSIDDPYAQVGLALRAANAVFGGREPQTRQEIREEIASLGPEQVDELVQQFTGTLLYGFPAESDMSMLRELKFHTAGPRGDGPLYRSVHWPSDRAQLLLAEERIEIRSGSEARGAELADVAALFQFPDGGRHVLRGDGYGIPLDPRWWRDGNEAVARLDSLVPRHLHLPGDERQLEPIPRVSPWLKVRAALASVAERTALKWTVFTLSLLLSVVVAVALPGVGAWLILSWCAFSFFLLHESVLADEADKEARRRRT